MITKEYTDMKEIEAAIRSCDICFVGMTDGSDSPYVIPMNFGYADGVLYLHSGPTGRSISMIDKNPNVCVTFCTKCELVEQNEEIACSYRMRAKSVIAWGKVTFVEDFQQKVDALNILMLQYTPRPFVYADAAVRNVKVWRMPIDRITCKGFGEPYHNR